MHLLHNLEAHGDTDQGFGVRRAEPTQRRRLDDLEVLADACLVG